MKVCPFVEILPIKKDTTYKYCLCYRIAIDYATACMRGKKKKKLHAHTLVSCYN